MIRISYADVPLGEKSWVPYLRQTKICHRGYGCYTDTEVIVRSIYNAWVMLQCLLEIEDPEDCIDQNHAHMITTNCLHVRILAQKRHKYEILLAAAGSSLNDDAMTVKQQIIKRASLAGIPLDANQFDISWEGRELQGITILMSTVLSPLYYSQDVEHAILTLSEPTNDISQYPATHNYVWYSQTRFESLEQVKSAQSPTAISR